MKQANNAPRTARKRGVAHDHAPA